MWINIIHVSWINITHIFIWVIILTKFDWLVLLQFFLKYNKGGTDKTKSTYLFSVDYMISISRQGIYVKEKNLVT